MKLISRSLVEGEAIPLANALGVATADGPAPGPNKSPQLAWSSVPASVRSFAVVAVDIDAPASAEDANKGDRTIPYDAPRAEFYHWLLIDIPVSVSELSEGLDADGLTPKGKPVGKTPHGVRGSNDYTKWFAEDEAMKGTYGGYDGPWPPFNDERIHRYVFAVYALDVESLGLSGAFSGADVKQAIEGHVLAEASITCTYALNPSAR